METQQHQTANETLRDLQTLSLKIGTQFFKNKLQELEDALVKQMLTWLIGLARLIGLTMCKMFTV